MQLCTSPRADKKSLLSFSAFTTAVTACLPPAQYESGRSFSCECARKTWLPSIIKSTAKNYCYSFRYFQ
jgi:hypothetical protein